ncbi:allergin-1 isoform X1 [Sceloporus undulatus]|uniref:allergin-1 isoform X1 n=1 Tax=Sceloporus undulatus TaxID=8520 RepID=UPI001C4CCA11|nr:allergin-1 isoform X1 [Sceloporus undulatus]
MPKSLGILYLLLASSHSCLQTKQNHDDEKDTSRNITSCSEHVKDLKIYSPLSETTIGRNITLECRSQKGCLPINYTLFLNGVKIHTIIKNKTEEKVVFTVTVNSISDVGEYKCRAQNRFNSGCKYSNGFNFTLKDQSKDVISCSDPVSDLEIYSPVSETEVGGKVTLECKSTARCLPINYTLFFKKDKALRRATKNKEEERIVFNFTINSTSELGEYKCRARNRFNYAPNNKYSHGFNFTLREAAAEEKNKLVVFIVAPLLLLLLLIVIAVAIPLMILPWCKAKNQKPASKSTHYTPANHLSSQACATYEDVAFHGKGEEVEYCNLNIGTTETDCRERILTEDSTVSYAEIIVRR